MTTYNTNGPIQNTTNANFQAWVNEIYTGLVTQCGLTQTADTGQMAVPCVSPIPAAGVYAGYYVFAFNDALQATAPIVFRLDFGSASGNAAIPALGITYGTASNGAGTITGTGTTGPAKQGLCANGVPGASLYNSYFCYNATQGVLWFSFKLGAQGGTNLPQMNLFIFRTVGNTGAPTADGAYFITVSSATGPGSYGCSNLCNYNTSTYAGPSSWFQIGGLASLPFGVTGSSVVGTTGQVFPVWQNKATSSTPGWGVTNATALAVLGDLPTGTTVSLNILGTLTMTYISTVMQPYAPYGTYGYANNSYAAMWLWQ